MDIRIINTCNNNCLYCLEQLLRSEKNFVDKEYIFSLIDEDSSDIFNIYWGNPLLHPHLNDIISYTQAKQYKSISVLTNTYWLNKNKLEILIKKWLTGIGFYFNTFSTGIHDILTGNGITLSSLVSNIRMISSSWIHSKAIIYVNAQNILYLHRDIYILYFRFWVSHFEFVNYFPFDRAYDIYDEYLAYDFTENRKYIDTFLKSLLKLKISSKFSKFPRDFFGTYDSFYDFEHGVLAQISSEDFIRMEDDIPSCYEISRCNNCFIKDNCKMHV